MNEIDTKGGTWEVFRRLENGSPFCVAPTCLFDERGVLVEWVFSQPKNKFKGWRVGRYDKHMVNLLSLFAEWEERAKKMDLEDSVCIGMTENRMFKLDLQKFGEMIRMLGRQEAEIRADTMDFSDTKYFQGPFFLQAYVPSKDGLIYETDFRWDAKTRAGRYESRLLDCETYFSHFKRQSSSSEINEKNEKKNDNVNKEKSGELCLEQQTVHNYLPPEESSVIGMEGQLRHQVRKIVEYLENTCKVSIASISVTHIRDARTGQWMILNVSNLIGDKVRRKKRVELLNSTEQLPMKKDEPKGKLETLDIERPKTAPIVEVKVPAITSPMTPFKPTSAKPGELWHDDRFLLTTDPKELQRLDEKRHFGPTWNKRLPEKPYHIYKSVNEERDETMVKMSRRLGDAMRTIEILQKRVDELEANELESVQSLNHAERNLNNILQRERQAAQTFTEREHGLLTRVDGLTKIVHQIETENQVLKEQLSLEKRRTINLTGKTTQLENELAKLKEKYNDIFQRYIYHYGTDTDEVQREMESFGDGEQDKLRELQARKARMDNLRLFKQRCFECLADCDSMGVSPPARISHSPSYPEPSRLNVQLVVKALVDGDFPEDFSIPKKGSSALGKTISKVKALRKVSQRKRESSMRSKVS